MSSAALILGCLEPHQTSSLEKRSHSHFVNLTSQALYRRGLAVRLELTGLRAGRNTSGPFPTKKNSSIHEILLKRQLLPTPQTAGHLQQGNVNALPVKPFHGKETCGAWFPISPPPCPMQITRYPVMQSELILESSGREGHEFRSLFSARLPATPRHKVPLRFYRHISLTFSRNQANTKKPFPRSKRKKKKFHARSSREQLL